MSWLRHGRGLTVVMALLVGLWSTVSVASPASAAPNDFTLQMPSGGGRVFIGSNPDPLPLQDTTTVTGTIDDETGEITDLALTTPPVTFEREQDGLVVEITAAFSMAEGMEATGQADGLGNVRLSAPLTLDLHVVVGGGAIVTDCVSSPIELELVSPEPYDATTQSVTLTDSQFAIPPVLDDGVCNPLVAGPINEQLAGPNNSISLDLAGPLTLPPPPADPSETALTADADTTPLGQPVTFTASVSPSDATGTVTFRNGTIPLGQVPVEEGGTASLTTSALPVGANQITARYSGDADYGPSESAVLVHTVTAVPGISADVPPYLVVGADPTPFTATVTNPGSGGDLPHLRVDLTFGPLNGLADGALVLEVDEDEGEGESWVPVDLTGGTVQTGSLGGLTGFSLPPGSTRVIDLRLSAAADAQEGTLPVQVDLSSVDGVTGEVLTTLSTATAETAIVPESRRPATATAAVLNATGTSSLIRQSYGLQLSHVLSLGGASPQPDATGVVEFLIDGEVVGTAEASSSGFASFTVASGADNATAGLAPGTHYASTRYRGNSQYRPALSEEVPFTVLPWIGSRYECVVDIILIKLEMMARMDVTADMPAGAVPGDLAVPRPEITLTFEGNLDFTSMPPPVDPTVTMTPGSGTFTAFTGEPPAPDAMSASVDLAGLSLTVPVEGEPGDVVEPTIDGFDAALPLIPGLNATLSCTAVEGEAATLDPVTVAGTTLSTTATNPVEEGTPVPLTAEVHPDVAQGVVEFLDGATSLGFAPVSDGRAQLNATGLAVGTHTITARHLGDLVNPPTTSEPIEVVVREAIECSAQADPGHAAVVRATYLLLLGRCPDGAGFSYWIDELDDGLSAEAFARSLATSPEAHRRSVDAAYLQVLDRSASAADQAFWGARLQAGGRYDVLIGDLAASPEFLAAAGGTPAGFVTLAYQRILERAPEPDGLAYWVGRLQAGEPRARVAAALVRLTEPTGTLVEEAFRAILQREPTASELAAEVARFQASGSRAAIYARLIGSEEFADLAQGFPNP